MKHLFTDIEYQSKPYPVQCYRSAKTVYEEQFTAGRLTSAGWNGAGYMLNVLDDMPTRNKPDAFGEYQTFGLTVDGRDLSYGWTLAGEEQTEQQLENGENVRMARLTLTRSDVPVMLTVCTMLDGTAVMTRWLEITNRADRSLHIGNITVMGGLMEHMDGWKNFVTPQQPENIYRLGYFENSNWGHEGAFRWHALHPNGTAVYGRYQADRYRHPMFMMENRARGGMFIAQMGWTGGYAFDFNLRADGDATDLLFKIRTDGPNPFITLAAGEKYTTPQVHMGFLFGSLDDAVNEMHEHLRRSVFTLPPARGVLGWVEGGMGPERLMDVKATKHFADTMAAIGAETMIIDAGWYCPMGTECKEWSPRVGDWTPDPERYPNGIAEIRDYIHEKGLLFGVWFDIERIGKASKLYEQHPDWAMKSAAGDITTMLDLTNPEVADWMENELARALEEYQIDLFRLDYNLGISSMFCPIREGESGTARYYQAVYRIYENLRRRFPHVVFENCAGGGGRTDVGMLKNFTHTWVSDWQVAPRSVAITNGMTMALPPEYVDRLVSGMNCHTRGSLEWTVRQTIFGRPTSNDYNAVGTTFNPEQIEFVRHTLDLYKEYLRPYIRHSKMYHHTPELYGEQPQGVAILERAAADGEAGALGVFALSDQARIPETVTVYPRGVDLSATYEVRMDNSGACYEISGERMSNEGIRVALHGALTSELIVYRKK